MRKRPSGYRVGLLEEISTMGHLMWPKGKHKRPSTSGKRGQIGRAGVKGDPRRADARLRRF